MNKDGDLHGAHDLLHQPHLEVEGARVLGVGEVLSPL